MSTKLCPVFTCPKFKQPSVTCLSSSTENGDVFFQCKTNAEEPHLGAKGCGKFRFRTARRNWLLGALNASGTQSGLDSKGCWLTCGADLALSWITRPTGWIPGIGRGERKYYIEVSRHLRRPRWSTYLEFLNTLTLQETRKMSTIHSSTYSCPRR